MDIGNIDSLFEGIVGADTLSDENKLMLVQLADKEREVQTKEVSTALILVSDAATVGIVAVVGYLVGNSLFSNILTNLL